MILQASSRLAAACLCGLTLLAPLPASDAADWERSVSPVVRGAFPELRPVRTSYRFGWNGIAAAQADIRLAKTARGFEFQATGGTIGLARTLWSYDVQHAAISDPETLRPIEVREVENIRSEKVTTNLTFTPEGVVSDREEREGKSVKSKTRRFAFPDTLSLNSSLLFLRTQPLAEGAMHRIVVYPATSAYLCTITASGRERISVPTGTYNAIKLDVRLEKIGKKRKLQPHKKFRRATVWLSDDADRLVLRIETQVFIGAVVAELQSVQFENAKP
ncbi:MAG: DUF3108 domain-containing protein [Verrucomicrobiota bacterium]|nr:DUF3108 domain-containing protein [Verrucomicrobiota bacterium]